MPPASSMSFRSLPANIMRPKSASSGKTLRADSNRHRRSRPSSSTPSPRSTFWAKRARRASRRRRAAKVPARVLPSIIRPPWICPGAPACSGKTHWVSSVTVSATDGMEQLFLPLSESGVEEIPEAVAEQVDAEHRQEERHTREDRDPGRRDQEGLPL